MIVREVSSPLTEKEARSLRAGELVNLSGEILTVRDEAHLRALELHRRGQALPFELDGRALYHCGPIMRRDGGWKVVAAGPTTLAARSLPEVIGVHWEDLGMPEAVWRMRAENFGPMVVAMDAHGRSLFQEVEDRTKRKASLLL